MPTQPSTKADPRADEVLALALRPRRLSALLGQKSLVRQIQSQIGSGRIPRAWLFTGPSGTGKTTVARIVALSYQLPRERFGEPTEEDWENWSNYCISEINASQVNGVDDIQAVAETANYAPLPGSKRRVFILDEAQRLSGPAQNLLLKYFEDAPKTATWIICTTEPQKILLTLRRRCYQLSLRVLGDEDRKKLLVRAKKTLPTTLSLQPLMEKADEIGVASPGILLSAYEKYAAGGSIAEALNIGFRDVDLLRLANIFWAGEWKSFSKYFGDWVSNENSKEFSLVLMGLLRGKLLRGNFDGRKPAVVASLIIRLSQGMFLEGNPHFSLLTAMLYEECPRFHK